MSYTLTRTSRRRTMEIMIADSKEIRVAAPQFATEREIRQFVRDKAHWILRKLKEVHAEKEFLARKQYDHGSLFLFLGKKYPLEVRETDIRQSRIAFDGERWQVKIPLAETMKERRRTVKDKLVQWYRAEAKEIFGGRIFHYARLMGLEPREINVKTQKRIWGSCAHHDKTINLNWHLVLSPLSVIDYVVVHELCHLEVPNHSQRFWKKVAKYLPDYKTRQDWLKNHHLDMTLP